MNFLSWVLLGLVLLALGVVLWSMFRKKQRGESSCGSCSSCSGCPMSGTCSKKPKQ